MKFNIENRTKYRTRHLRSFVVRAYRVAATCAGPGRVAGYESRIKRLRISFARANHRGSAGVTGHAYLNSDKAHVGLGDDADRRQVARVIAHEIGHVFGLQHSDMSGGPLMGNASERVFGWADALPLEAKPQRQKPNGDERRAAKLRGIETRLKSWHTKQKRAATAIRKLTMQQRRLMRQEEARDVRIP